MSNKISLLQKLFKNAEIDGYLIPSTDEYLNEYVPQYLRRLEAITCFTGSYGVAVISTDAQHLLTDGRYTLQAKKQLSNAFKIHTSLGDLVNDIGDLRIGFDPMTMSQSQYLQFSKSFIARKNILLPLEQNLVDKVQTIVKPINSKKAYELDIKFAGRSRDEKIKDILRAMHKDADHLFLTNPDSICWLLNIRGHDVDFTPYLLSYLLLDNNGNIKLFTDPKAVPELKGIEVIDISKIKIHFQMLIDNNLKVQADISKTPHWFFHVGKAQMIPSDDPCELLKAIKNDVEITGFREAHIEDGIAVTKFLYWLDQNAPKYKIDEITAAEKLLEFRKERKLFQYPSFETIAGFGSNGAIVHYKATPQTNKIITIDNLFLLDSGGQYLNGTTDITRSICLGTPTPEQKKFFTLVLKGHINLASAKFPEGTTGQQLDSLARCFLWQHGADYAHGTGHGVGHFLSVHEGPQRISKNGSNVALKENMILSNEPGYYKENHYGIRIENLIRVIKSKTKGFLEFENLTLAPIPTNLIDKGLMNEKELLWLNQYNAGVCKILTPHLLSKEQIWLKQYINF